MTATSKQSTAQQLPLPCTVEEATSLLEDLTTLRQTAMWQRSEIAALQEQLDAAKANCETWRERHRLAEAQLTAAHAEIALLQTNLTVARSVVLNRVPTLPDWLSSELRRLVALAHPDRWCQPGQDATTLAHEAVIVVNGLRERLGEVMA